MSKPFYYLWAYDSHHERVILEHNDDRPKNEEVTHSNILDDLPNDPDNELGYAYRIDGGWRITNDEHDPVEDPFIVDKIKKRIQEVESLDQH